MKYDSKINVRCEDSLKSLLEGKADKEGMKLADFIRWVLRKEVKR